MANEPQGHSIGIHIKRILARINGWRTTGRVEGAWYWVTDGRDVWPAMASASSAGGWSNNDTWEDFSRDVIAWKRISAPSAPCGKV